jgi:twin BRCT domain
LITEEERQPYKQKTIAEVFKNCKIYVEVRTGDDNRSEGIKSRLLRDGIVVNEKLYKDTTHVIFKDGLLSTFNKAVKSGIPITTILWIDSCISQRRIVDTAKFKISNLDRYEHPELYKRMRRQKSMQPDVPMIFYGTPTSAVLLERSFSQDDSRTNTKHFDNETVHEVSDKNDNMELTSQPSVVFCASPRAFRLRQKRCWSTYNIHAKADGANRNRCKIGTQQT